MNVSAPSIHAYWSNDDRETPNSHAYSNHAQPIPYDRGDQRIVAQGFCFCTLVIVYIRQMKGDREAVIYLKEVKDEGQLVCEF